MNSKTRAILAAKLALSLALLWLVLAKVDLASIVAILAQADPWLVTVWYSMGLLGMALSAWRWEVLAPGLDFRTALKYTWIGVFFSHLLPGSISGDVAKGVSLALKDANARTGLAASIVVDKVIGLAVLVVFFDLACAFIYFVHGDASHLRSLAGIALVLSAGVAVAAVAVALVARRGSASWEARAGAVGKLLDRVVAAAGYYSNKPALVAKATLISVAIHVVNVLATYLSLRALNIEASLAPAAVIYSVSSIVLLVPISISGIGVRDATLAVLFPLFGLAAAGGVALSWLGLLAVIPNLMIGGVVLLYEMYRAR
jgi:glycosyltransferase 2 family protein